MFEDPIFPWVPETEHSCYEWELNVKWGYSFKPFTTPPTPNFSLNVIMWRTVNSLGTVTNTYNTYNTTTDEYKL